MDWMALLGSLFGQSTSTTTPNIPPEVQAAMTKLFSRGNTAVDKPYTPYTGQRVAGPSQSRTQLDPMMASISQKVMGGMNDANGYQSRIGNLLNRAPNRVTAPSMVPGGAQVQLPQAPMMPPIPGV